MLSALAEEDDSLWRALATPKRLVRFCANSAYEACKWLVPAEASGAFCQACRLNRTIPDLGPPEHLLRWQRLEAAKHRLVYSLLRLGLPVVSKFDNPDAGLAFDFLADPGAPFQETPQVVTGHAQGLITINIAEADDAERERARQDMAEPYGTLLGHFRHEVGHYYLGTTGPRRPLAGVVSQDVRRRAPGLWRLSRTASLGGPAAGLAGALRQCLRQRPSVGGLRRDLGALLHIVDTLETAAAFGLRVHPKAGRDPALATEIEFDPYRQNDFDALLKAWLPLTYAVNSLNHSMGQPDLYPFVLAPAVMAKLRFAHGLVHPSGA